MSFVDQRGGVRPASIAAVVAVHAVIGYAIISGLAMQVVRFVDPPLITAQYPADMPPPPPLPDLPPATQRTTVQPAAQPDRIVDVPLQDPGIVISQLPAEPVRPALPSVADTPPSRPGLARGTAFVGNRATWVTSDDYPASSARAEAQGVTAILVSVGTDGRASNCRVTAGSGDRALDEAACRTYVRRARFTPALDEAGKPIVSERADRIRWQLPTQ